MRTSIPERITSFEQLRTWQEAKSFTVEVYKLTREFPPDEIYAITSQIRRSANSVPANIAEGFSRKSAADKIHFYIIALGSLTESLSHLYISEELGYINNSKLAELKHKQENISKMLNGMIKAAKTKGEDT